MLEVIGAGLPRTGTYSLRAALTMLLGGDCYHMRTVRENADHVPIWLDALNGNLPDWPALFSGCTAAVDWPVSAFWREIAAAFPDALILLSVRKDAATWWRSFNENIVPMISQDPALENEPWHTMAVGLCDRELGKTWDDQTSAEAAYSRHIEIVRTAVSAPAGPVATRGWMAAPLSGTRSTDPGRAVPLPEHDGRPAPATGRLIQLTCRLVRSTSLRGPDDGYRRFMRVRLDHARETGGLVPSSLPLSHA
jgi:hypothetical protein